jgi:hypothetical protein
MSGPTSARLAAAATALTPGIVWSSAGACSYVGRHRSISVCTWAMACSRKSAWAKIWLISTRPSATPSGTCRPCGSRPAFPPAIELLRQVWVQNYLPTDDGLRWPTNEDGLPPASRFISSPYEPEADLALKQSTAWIGYKVHLTETCPQETPNLITDAQTVLAPIADWDSLPVIHQGLAKRDLLPNQHLVDSGYVDAALLVASRREFGIDLVGPPWGDQHWQARELSPVK